MNADRLIEEWRRIFIIDSPLVQNGSTGSAKT